MGEMRGWVGTLNPIHGRRSERYKKNIINNDASTRTSTWEISILYRYDLRLYLIPALTLIEVQLSDASPRSEIICKEIIFIIQWSK